jgi:hypothetical protein
MIIKRKKQLGRLETRARAAATAAATAVMGHVEVMVRVVGVVVGRVEAAWGIMSMMEMCGGGRSIHVDSN